MSYLYRVYGLNIESEIEVPELSKLDNNSNILRNSIWWDKRINKNRVYGKIPKTRYVV